MQDPNTAQSKSCIIQIMHDTNLTQIQNHGKVQLFWEGHKSAHNRPHGFEIYLSKHQNYKLTIADGITYIP